MERRGFLGGLTALPLLTYFNTVKEKGLENIKPNIQSVNPVVSSGNTSDLGGKFCIVGTIIEDDGTETMVYRTSNGEYGGSKIEWMKVK